MKNTFAKIFLALVLSLSSTALFGDIVQTKLDITKRTMNTQDTLANAINLYLETYGVAPATLNDLATAGILPTTFPNNNGFTIDTTSVTMTLTNTLDMTWETYQADFYVNSVDRKADFLNGSVSGVTATSIYQISPSAIKSVNYANAGIVVSPTAPATVVDGDAWYDSMKKIVFIKKGASWLNSNGTSLWIIRTVGELPSTALKGDIAIIIDTTNIEKRIYSGSAWEVTNSLAYSYNGSL